MSKRADQPKGDQAAGLSIDAAVGAGGALAGGLLGDPLIAAAIGLSGPVAAAGLKTAASILLRRRQEKLDIVLLTAAEHLGVPVPELLERLQADPSREEFLLRTLRAVGEAALHEKLLGLAASLTAVVEGHAAPSEETVFVRALDDCDGVHLEVIHAFTKTPNELGLGDGSDEPLFMQPCEQLTADQLVRVFPVLAAHLAPVVAVLQRHGLVEPQLTSTTFPGSSQVTSAWRITTFGRAFCERVLALQRLVQQAV